MLGCFAANKWRRHPGEFSQSAKDMPEINGVPVHTIHTHSYTNSRNSATATKAKYRMRETVSTLCVQRKKFLRPHFPTFAVTYSLILRLSCSYIVPPSHQQSLYCWCFPSVKTLMRCSPSYSTLDQHTHTHSRGITLVQSSMKFVVQFPSPFNIFEPSYSATSLFNYSLSHSSVCRLIH